MAQIRSTPNSLTLSMLWYRLSTTRILENTLICDASNLRPRWSKAEPSDLPGTFRYREPSRKHMSISTVLMCLRTNYQPVIPNVTASWSGSIIDPPSREYPLCTLKSFPHNAHHAVVWARDKFEKLFANQIRDLQSVCSRTTSETALQVRFFGWGLSLRFFRKKKKSMKWYAKGPCVVNYRL